MLSLIFWALALTITAKYLTIVLRTDNRGEGGVLALTALVGTEGSRRFGGIAAVLGLAGCALFYGDGFITPAVTVLGAIEGLEIVAPGFARVVVPLSIIALLVLFSAQSRGTGALGGLFGPVMLIWFLVLGALGVGGIVQHPEVLAAANPHVRREFRGIAQRYRIAGGRLGVPRSHRWRGVVCGSGALRREAYPHGNGSLLPGLAWS